MAGDILDTIRAVLGPKTSAQIVQVGDRGWTVHRAPSRAWKSGAPDYDAMTREAEEVAKDDRLRTLNVRHFVGEGGTALFAVPELPPLDVVELARVGTHNGGPDEWRDVQNLLRATVGTKRFDIVFADEAGLDVRVLDPLTKALAREWERVLLDRVETEPRWLDSYSFMLGAVDDGSGTIVPYILKKRSLRFWWD